MNMKSITIRSYQVATDTFSVQVDSDDLRQDVSTLGTITALILFVLIGRQYGDSRPCQDYVGQTYTLEINSVRKD